MCNDCDRLLHLFNSQGFRNDNKTFHKTFPDIPEEEDLTHGEYASTGLL